VGASQTGIAEQDGMARLAGSASARRFDRQETLLALVAGSCLFLAISV
jgi:hypothetical protein